MVVKTKHISHLIKETGFFAENRDEILRIADAHYEFLPREAAEEDPGYKQIIPYAVICRSGEVFVTRRLNKGGERRLHGLMSIGLGGHINPGPDGGGMRAVTTGLMRELNEEVRTEQIGEIVMRGVINDDSNPVGSVHLGFLFTIETTGDVWVKETEKLSGEWVKRGRLSDLAYEMETWSQIATGALFK
ncbi:MAG: NUDIX domain-containing protein [Oscillospiraceae bacterium]|nr:NUDIX domain-containing protein [Oscillospiraceae bacterium]